MNVIRVALMSARHAATQQLEPMRKCWETLGYDFHMVHNLNHLCYFQMRSPFVEWGNHCEVPRQEGYKVQCTMPMSLQCLMHKDYMTGYMQRKRKSYMAVCPTMVL